MDFDLGLIQYLHNSPCLHDSMVHCLQGESAQTLQLMQESQTEKLENHLDLPGHQQRYSHLIPLEWTSIDCQRPS